MKRKDNLSLQVEDKQPELRFSSPRSFYFKIVVLYKKKITLQRGTWCSVEGIHSVTQIPNSSWSS